MMKESFWLEGEWVMWVRVGKRRIVEVRLRRVDKGVRWWWWKILVVM